jgi:hypothetical protein
VTDRSLSRWNKDDEALRKGGAKRILALARDRPIQPRNLGLPAVKGRLFQISNFRLEISEARAKDRARAAVRFVTDLSLSRWNKDDEGATQRRR